MTATSYPHLARLLQANQIRSAANRAALAQRQATFKAVRRATAISTAVSSMQSRANVPLLR